MIACYISKERFHLLRYVVSSSLRAEKDFLCFINDMEKYTLRADRKAATLKRFMDERLDARELLMSGSGPTMVAYYEDVNKARRGMTALAELIEEDCSIRAWLTDSGR